METRKDGYKERSSDPIVLTAPDQFLLILMRSLRHTKGWLQFDRIMLSISHISHTVMGFSFINMDIWSAIGLHTTILRV